MKHRVITAVGALYDLDSSGATATLRRTRLSLRWRGAKGSAAQGGLVRVHGALVGDEITASPPEHVTQTSDTHWSAQHFPTVFTGWLSRVRRQNGWTHARLRVVASAPRVRLREQLPLRVSTLVQIKGRLTTGGFIQEGYLGQVTHVILPFHRTPPAVSTAEQTEELDAAPTSGVPRLLDFTLPPCCVSGGRALRARFRL